MIGRKVVIYPKTKDNWEVIPNLWGCLIAPPGSMKSPALSSVLKPIQNLAVKAREEFLEATQKMEGEKLVAKTEIEALKDALKSAVKQGKQDLIAERKRALSSAIEECEKKYVVTERRYMMNDPTIEKLLTIIQENPQGLLLYRDELSGWMETMYKSGREGDREFFLESWNGDSPYSMDRIGRGSVFVDGLCLSVLGGLQPTKFQSYVSSLAQGGKSDDGLLQRLQILLYPGRRKTWEKIDRLPDEGAENAANQLFLKLSKVPLPERTEEGVKRVKIHFDPPAQLVFDQWRENLENRLLSGTMSPILESHLSKYRSMMPSLAYIFEVVESIGSNGEMPTTIGLHAANLAVKWCAFLENHAKKAYGEHIEPEIYAARKLLQKIIAGAIKDFDRCREIYRHGWKGISSLEEFDKGLGVLEKLGWARSELFVAPTGRRCDIIRLHPSLRLGLGFKSD
jgi:putative DNA primase/helicase